MGKPQIITSPAGEELVVPPRQDYEDLIDALAASKAHASIAAGEEVLTSEETAAYVAAPSPLAFWRKKRGLTQEMSLPMPECRRTFCRTSNAARPRAT